MSAGHTATVKLAQIEATRRGWRLFRNEVGLAWVGTVMETFHRVGKRGAQACTTLADARPIRYGLGRGSFDTVGWIPREIRREDIPEGGVLRIAQFATVDAKTDAYSRMSPEQRIWSREVKAAGGYVGIAMRVDGRAVLAEIGEE